MERISQMMNRAHLTHMQPIHFDVSSNQWRCDEFNAQSEECTDGYECEYCRNKGVYYMLDNDSEIYSTPCPECGHIRKSIRLFILSGLDNLTFEGFTTAKTWQEKLLNAAKEYVKADNSWFFIGGQSGAGKTHLCSAIIHELIFTRHEPANVLHWIEGGRKLKSLVNSEAEYDKEKDKYINTPVLYIDDFFKTKSGESVSAADVRLAFEIINYRYNNKLKTIISSEKSLYDIVGIDEALGGRIKQMAGKYALTINNNQSMNYRLVV